MAARKGRILVVENDPHERTTLAAILADYGYDIETAADGFKALPKLKDFSPELIVSDLRMPGLDGLGLLAKSREHDPDVFFVLTTGDSGVQTAVTAMRPVP